MERALPPAIEKNLQIKYNLDAPLWEQYGKYLKDVASGDLGPSFSFPDMTVNDVIEEGFPVSLALGLKSVFVSLLLGIPAGVIAAVKHGHWQDRVLSFLTVMGIAIPGFIMASFMVFFFAVYFRILPAAMWEGWRYEIMPIAALSFGPLAVITRLTRSSMLDVLGQDYIKLARAKGMSSFTVLYRHALPNALIPVVTILGPLLAGIVTGSFVIESIFAVPGIGRAFVNSITNRDYTLILGLTVFYSILLIVMNTVIDILYPLIDPRIKITARKEGKNG